MYMRICELPACSLDLKDIKVVTKLGGTVDDSEQVEGMVFDHKAAKSAGGPTRMENAKIGLIQFQISPPKTDLENNVSPAAWRWPTYCGTLAAARQPILQQVQAQIVQPKSSYSYTQRLPLSLVHRARNRPAMCC